MRWVLMIAAVGGGAWIAYHAWRGLMRWADEIADQFDVPKRSH